MATDGQKLKAYVDQRGLNKTKLAEAMGMTKQNLYQLFKSVEFAKSTIENIEKGVHDKWANIQKVNIDVNIQEEDREVRQTEGTGTLRTQEPLIDTILNLTYSSKRTADGIDKMADANLINARSIETLVKILAASLGATGLKGVSLEDLQKGDVPVESFLGGQPVLPVKGKKSSSSHSKKGN